MKAKLKVAGWAVLVLWSLVALFAACGHAGPGTVHAPNESQGRISIVHVWANGQYVTCVEDTHDVYAGKAVAISCDWGNQ